jgi:Flp pilus assembly pilin Flp
MNTRSVTTYKNERGTALVEYPILLVALLLVVASIQSLSTTIRYKVVYASCALHAGGGTTGVIGENEGGWGIPGAREEFLSCMEDSLLAAGLEPLPDPAG